MRSAHVSPRAPFFHVSGMKCGAVGRGVRQMEVAGAGWGRFLEQVRPFLAVARG